MAYLAVNKNGTEVRFDGAKTPIRDIFKNEWSQLVIKRDCTYISKGTTLPFGSIMSIIGQKKTWYDDAIKI